MYTLCNDLLLFFLNLVRIRNKMLLSDRGIQLSGDGKSLYPVLTVGKIVGLSSAPY